MFFIPFDSCTNNYHGNDLWGNKFPLHAEKFAEELRATPTVFEFPEAANLISFKLQFHAEHIGLNEGCETCKIEPIIVTLGDFK